MGMFTQRTRAEGALVLATFLWGLTFPFIRISLTELSPLMLLLLRACMAALVFLPFVLLVKKNRSQLPKLIPVGAILGSLYFCSYLSQTIGLQTITSARSAFLTNLSVVFVPLLSPLFRRGMPNRNDLISCLIALVGMFLLTNPTGEGGFARGDLWTLVCAFCFTLQIHVLQIAMGKFHNETLFSFLQVVFISCFSLFFIPVTGAAFTLPQNMHVIGAVFYLGAIGMVCTTWLQTRYQYLTTPERASVIYILEPVFAGVFAFFLLNEHMSFRAMLGGAVIIFSVLYVYFVKMVRNLLKIIQKNRTV